MAQDPNFADNSNDSPLLRELQRMMRGEFKLIERLEFDRHKAVEEEKRRQAERLEALESIIAMNYGTPESRRDLIDGTVAERMAVIFKQDQRCVDWTAKEWSKRLGCSESAVKKPDNYTWKAILRERHARKVALKKGGYKR